MDLVCIIYRPKWLEQDLMMNSVPGGSRDVLSTVTTTLIGVINSYKYSHLIYTPSY